MHQYFISFCGWIVFCDMNVPHFVYPVVSGWAFELSPPFNDCELCYYEHWCKSFCLNRNAFLEVLILFPCKTQACLFVSCWDRGGWCATALQMPKQSSACSLVISFSPLFLCLLMICFPISLTLSSLHRCACICGFPPLRQLGIHIGKWISSLFRSDIFLINTMNVSNSERP